MDDLAARVDALRARALQKSGERKTRAEEAQALRAQVAENARAQLRADMPAVADIVDQFRAVFGPGVKVLAACEKGKSVINRAACERVGVNWRAYVAK